MLTDQDIKKIGEELGNVIEHNVTPAIEELRDEVKSIRAVMVTKEYLDDKLSDLRGDLVVIMRKEDRKLVRLVEMLKIKKILEDKEVKEVLSMEPFPQLFA